MSFELLTAGGALTTEESIVVEGNLHRDLHLVSAHKLVLNYVYAIDGLAA